MRLPEIFHISGKSKVKNCQRSKQARYTYPGFECWKILRNLPKILPKLRNQPDNVKNVPEFLVETVDFQRFWYIFDIFDINIQNMPQNGFKIDQIWPIMAQKWSKIMKIIPKFWTTYQKWQTFDFQQTVKNVPKYLDFCLRKSVKLYRTSKILPQHMVLVCIFILEHNNSTKFDLKRRNAPSRNLIFWRLNLFYRITSKTLWFSLFSSKMIPEYVKLKTDCFILNFS